MAAGIVCLGDEPSGIWNLVSEIEAERIEILDWYHQEGISIGSGAVESTIKQIGRRVKVSGAQWKQENVPQFYVIAVHI